MSISGYVMKFEHQITESHKMEVLYGVLPYRILNNANLPEEKKKLLRATVNEMKQKILKEHIKKVFTSFSCEKRSREKDVNLEQSDSFYAEDFNKREHNENVLQVNHLLKIIHSYKISASASNSID